MNCSACGSDNSEDAQFCGTCGSALNASTANGSGGGTANLPMVSWQDAIRLAFKNYFNFRGRARRSEYWWFALFLLLVGPAANLILFLFVIVSDEQISGDSAILEGVFWAFLKSVIPAVTWPVQFVSIIPFLAVTTRRLHDIGKSGWWTLLYGGTLVGVLGLDFGETFHIFIATVASVLAAITASVILMIWLARQGSEGPSKYGQDPRKTTSQQPYKP